MQLPEHGSAACAGRGFLVYGMPYANYQPVYTLCLTS